MKLHHAVIVAVFAVLSVGMRVGVEFSVAQAKPCVKCGPCDTCKTRADVDRAVSAGGRPPHELWVVMHVGAEGAATWFMTEADADAYVASVGDAAVAGPFHAIMNGYDK